MSIIDVSVIVAVITVFGGFAGGLVTVFGNKNQKIIDLISTRLAQAESRLDHLEEELADERHRRMTLMVYATAIRAWADRAWEVIRRKGIDFDAPPEWNPVASEDQMLVPRVERKLYDARKEEDAEG